VAIKKSHIFKIVEKDINGSFITYVLKHNKKNAPDLDSRFF